MQKKIKKRFYKNKERKKLFYILKNRVVMIKKYHFKNKQIKLKI